MVMQTGRFSARVIGVCAAVMFLWWIFNIEILSYYSSEYETSLETGFVVFMILFLWSYLRTVFSDPGWP